MRSIGFALDSKKAKPVIPAGWGVVLTMSAFGCRESLDSQVPKGVWFKKS